MNPLRESTSDLSNIRKRESLFIGWDVGGWNCDKNPTSRDALIVLGHAGECIGRPWRGNLRTTINTAASTSDFLARLLALCRVDHTADAVQAVLAIDAPLGFPEVLRTLLSYVTTLDTVGQSAENPYLYRFTERRLVSEGLTPLSVIKDMIGSQSTKAMHVVARFCPERVEPGVWSDRYCLRVIETYPTLCRLRASGAPKGASKARNGWESDISDALVCAQMARDFAMERHGLEAPPPEAPQSEGWIWAPLPRNREPDLQFDGGVDAGDRTLRTRSR